VTGAPPGGTAHRSGVKSMSSILEDDAPTRVRAYHQITKHGFGTYARGPGQMDWAAQPDPFRRYAGAPSLELPLAAHRYSTPYADLFQPGAVPVHPVTREAIGVLLELSFGLSAWKGYDGERWALRCNPSSGNLHPTEAYLVAGGTGGLEPGVYHYVSHDHALERRCDAALPFRGLLVGLASIHWREAWKYGERAYRYCQHDVGHALAALRYAAGVLGWSIRVMDSWSDADIAGLLGLDRNEDLAGAEPEAPDLLCRIDVGAAEPLPDIDALVAAARNGAWKGTANRLSRRHLYQWPVIEEIHAAAEKPRTAAQSAAELETAPPWPSACELSAPDIIRQRRSAQAFDGVTAIGAKALFRMLDATLPRAGTPPFDAFPWPPRVHLALFVHRVTGLPPGLYLFCRTEAAAERLHCIKKEDYGWEPAEQCPDHFRLFRLIRADTRQAARALSCHQDIASDGAFSLGMLAEFDVVLKEQGPWAYRRLFWETGLIGQALYLEAEAAGVRGTGIGCFFDDPMHELLGLSGTEFQNLYHFTVGGPIVDTRLETLPPYGHLAGR
jgi:SagB-type dehydrogenase family enzyme